MQGKQPTLVCSLGLTPQVLTETLYALWKNEGSTGWPGKLSVVTTRQGADRAALVLAGAEGAVARFCREYETPPLALHADAIAVIDYGSHAAEEGIRSAEGAARAAEATAKIVAQLCEEDQPPLHVSLAGGRKVSAFYWGQAMMLFGRRGDRLSHVFVSEEFENHPEFYYPTRQQKVIFSRLDGRPLNCALARVDLIEVPFLRLRPWMKGIGLEQLTGYREMLGRAQQRLDANQLRIFLGSGQIEYQGSRTGMAPAELAFLALFSERRLQGASALECPSDGAPDRELAKAYLNLYRRIVQPSGQPGRTVQALRHGMTKAFFLERKSRLREALRQAWGAVGMELEIQAIGRRPDTRYELARHIDCIEFLDETAPDQE